MINPEKAGEAACGCTEQKGSLIWTGRAIEVSAQRRACLLFWSQHQILKVSTNISQSQLLYLQTEATLEDRIKLYNLHILFLLGQGTLPEQRYISICYTSRNQNVEEKFYPWYSLVLLSWIFGSSKNIWLIDAASNYLVGRQQSLPLDLAGCSR